MKLIIEKIFQIIKREKGPAPLPPLSGLPTPIKESSPLVETKPKPVSASPTETTNALKIVEDDEKTNSKLSLHSEAIPPPPPEFANERSLEDLQNNKTEIRNNESNEYRIAVHQEIRRSFSVDSPNSSNLFHSNKLNTSMITISDTSNSLAVNNINQVTVVTTHPPVIIDNSREVIIVSNETNKSQHVQESTDDDDYHSHDSLETSPKNKALKKLDESEVLIVSPFEEEISREDGRKDLDRLDTSHVSVVTVGDEQVKVKDSSHLFGDSNSDLSHTESSDGVEFGKINGPNSYNSKRSSSSREDDVNIIVKTGTNKHSSDISVESLSVSVGGNLPGHGQIMEKATVVSPTKQDRSDVESISTTASHDSDVDGVQLRKKEPEIQQPSSPKRPTRTKEEIQIANLKKKTRKRTRRFEIDGVQVTTTTSKVIYGDDENGRMYDDHIFRKQELRELKMLQKQEKKQFYDLQAKEQIAKEQQDKKFEQERLALERTYEADMDVLARQHKQHVEKYEQQQENELRNTSKKIRMEQERELKLVKIFKKTQKFSF